MQEGSSTRLYIAYALHEAAVMRSAVESGGEGGNKGIFVPRRSPYSHFWDKFEPYKSVSFISPATGPF